MDETVAQLFRSLSSNPMNANITMIPRVVAPQVFQINWGSYQNFENFSVSALEVERRYHEALDELSDRDDIMNSDHVEDKPQDELELSDRDSDDIMNSDVEDKPQAEAKDESESEEVEPPAQDSEAWAVSLRPPGFGPMMPPPPDESSRLLANAGRTANLAVQPPWRVKGSEGKRHGKGGKGYGGKDSISKGYNKSKGSKQAMAPQDQGSWRHIGGGRWIWESGSKGSTV